MTFLKRGILSIFRNLGKSLLLLAIVFFLGLLLSSATFIRNAINQTEVNLRSRLPAIATLDWEFRAEGYLDNGIAFLEFPTAEMILEVGQLSYVRSYDFNASSSIISQDLEWVSSAVTIQPLIDELIQDNPTLFDALSLEDISIGIREQGGQVEWFPLQGVRSTNPSDLELGIISLTSGRFMTEIELEQGSPVAVISEAFAEINDLQIGSTFILEDNIYDDVLMYESGIMANFMYWHLDDFLIAQEVVEVEVIGIFDVNNSNLYIDRDNAWGIAVYLAELYNTIYLPFQLQESMVRNLLPYTMELIERRANLHGNVLVQTNLTDELPLELTAIFTLHDPRDLSAFAEAAAGILPEGWGIYDFSNAFAPIASSMDSMLEIADLIFWGGILATIVVLGLVITLFLRDRQQEIGIYRALGESKQKIMGQILIEILLISMIGIVFAFFVGSMLSSEVSRNMLEQDLLQQEQEEAFTSQGIVEAQTFGIRQFAPGPMSIEEMMEAYDTSMDTGSIILFFGVQIVVVLFSTVIPIVYVMKLEPRDILMKGSIG